ncbi:hypothetical protein G4D82_07155 [Flavobacterium sp. CYK-4]|uniref:hypothetical protein n=1 Tax=Flavobacterium lotistagni TaxID=2709660 RepID=UPI00140953E0|nr:hypothetical protein [Flavobacterium lotistagni]NHM06995.1 hypothetical protein [Flavobacterium lotistagni]
MMEELDVLKKAWKNQDASYNQVSENDIYAMLHRKSSSIVKWILIVSIIEFVFWNIISFAFSDEKYQNKLESYGIEDIMFIVNVINYVIVVGFIYVFYKNYRSISTLDSTSKLMQSIVNTRKTVQYYIWYNLFIVTLTIIISIVMMFAHNPDIISMMNEQISEGHESIFIFVCVLVSMAFIALVIGVFWLFYRLIYGILLKKLFANYKELKKIEV